MNVTELDDLKAAWQTLNQNLERQSALAFLQFKENKVSRFRSGMRPLVLGQLIQLALGIVIATGSAQFWVKHLDAPTLLISGLLLHAYGIMFIALAARDLLLIHRIDYAAPVIDIQRRLAELRAWHIRAALWHGFAGSVAWLPALMVILHLMGAPMLVDNPRTIVWLGLTALVCLAVPCILMCVARSPGRWGEALRKSWIGLAVNRAQASLDEIAQFEKE